ncbi:MAG: 1-deoxy-D-xylulose-5-phosphate reductoisomerase [bacterium]|nr:1-deoxy-D-xylulose-5-phosphate reductoisomerase [bacterium]MBU1917423.1 1-deoxy-D-xylulose-5-phosphate reductoisomerase [bacterium]
MKKISILGSTGSIGISTLDICRQHPDRFEVVGLAAGRNIDLLLQQISEFKPKIVSIHSEEDYQNLSSKIPTTTEIVFGSSGTCAVATLSECDLVISAIVGAAGLAPTLAAIEEGKDIGLANKESMVIAGEIMSERAAKNNVKILPVDSEHSAIFQCLNGENVKDVNKIILTASGGPFLHTAPNEFEHITKEQALKHPNWDMGAKITIDSASMMNKGLEVMEAHWLFNMPIEKIDVVVHPQSIIHSMVEFVDASVVAQLGEPDMRVPIAYALSYPRRMTTQVTPLDLTKHRELTFYKPDLEKFKCLKLAFQVASKGKTYAPVLNAANEVAVAAFLQDQIRFIQIPELIDVCLQAHMPISIDSIDTILSADSWARKFVITSIGNIS